MAASDSQGTEPRRKGNPDQCPVCYACFDERCTCPAGETCPQPWRAKGPLPAVRQKPGHFRVPDAMPPIPTGNPGDRIEPLPGRPEWRPMKEVPNDE